MGYSYNNNNIVFHNTLQEEPDIDHDIKSIRALWRAVITQALMDAASTAKKTFIKQKKYAQGSG